MWCRGEVVITTAQLHSTVSELKFCASSNPACGVSEIRDGENLLQWSRVDHHLHHHHHHHQDFRMNYIQKHY